MSTDLEPKVPRGYERQSKDIVELSEGISPAAGLQMLPWLPIAEANRRSEFDIGIKAGMLVAIYQHTDGKHYYVPTNGGRELVIGECGLASIADIPSAFAYSSLDVDTTINMNTGELVTEDDIDNSGTGYIQLPANAPVGYTLYDFYHDQEHLYNNMQIQTYEKQARCDRFLELPVVTAAQLLSEPGDLVITDPAYPGRWRPLRHDDTDNQIFAGANAPRRMSVSGTPTGAEWSNLMAQIVGKVWTIEEVTDIDNLSKEIPYPGLGLTGSGTGGVPPHLRNATSFDSEQYRVKMQFGAFCS